MPALAPSPAPEHILAVATSGRAALADTVEEIGQALGLLLEAADIAGEGNADLAQECCADAALIVADLETRFSRISADLARWIQP